ncbi:MAG TPA: hypothetical protein PLS42_13800 [Candidatus Competibacter denitrificans]|nr:hypothetical protein [Candidatus Competibacter denitrificans]
MLRVDEVAKLLDCLPESIRWTCAKMKIPITDGAFEYPADPAMRERWHKLLVSRPLNLAEQIRRDLGCRPPRR